MKEDLTALGRVNALVTTPPQKFFCVYFCISHSISECSLGVLTLLEALCSRKIRLTVFHTVAREEITSKEKKPKV